MASLGPLFQSLSQAGSHPKAHLQKICFQAHHVTGGGQFLFRGLGSLLAVGRGLLSVFAVRMRPVVFIRFSNFASPLPPFSTSSATRQFRDLTHVPLLHESLPDLSLSSNVCSLFSVSPTCRLFWCGTSSFTHLDCLQ